MATVSVDVLAELFAKRSRMIPATACPCGVPVPKKPWLTDGTWEAVRFSWGAKKRLFALDRCVAKLKSRDFFLLWVGATRG